MHAIPPLKGARGLSPFRTGRSSRLRDNPLAAKAASPLYQRGIIIEVAHDLFQLTTADENALDSPFEGGEGVVSVSGWTVLST